jgi:hypothetical protein
MGSEPEQYGISVDLRYCDTFVDTTETHSAPPDNDNSKDK